jgi:hypothetical protein
MNQNNPRSLIIHPFPFRLDLALQNHFEHGVSSTLARNAIRVFQATTDGIDFAVRRGDGINQNVCAKTMNDVGQFKLVPVSMIVRRVEPGVCNDEGISFPLASAVKAAGTNTALLQSAWRRYVERYQR